MVGEARLNLEVSFGSEADIRKRIRVVSLSPESDMLIVGCRRITAAHATESRRRPPHGGWTK
jgi:hypothetical protein